MDSYKFYSIALMASLILTACNESEFSGAQKGKGPQAAEASKAVTQTFTAQDLKKGLVDIIFAIDQSGSMRAEQERLRANLNNFITSFEKSASGVDYQIFVIDNSFSVPSGVDAARVAPVKKYIGSYDALNVVLSFLSGGAPTTLTRRNEAAIEVIVISDDNGGQRGGMNASSFRSSIQAQYPNKKFHLHSMVGLPTSSNNTWCNIVQPGNEYIALSKDATYGGLVLDLCTENWGELLTRLGNQIGTTNASQTFTLEKTPDLSKAPKVYVNNTLLNASQYTIDASANTLTFREGALTANASIKIVYTSK